MEIYLGADHRGLELKNVLLQWLEGQAYTVTDIGAEEYNEKDDYPDIAAEVARAVAKDPAGRRGIILCGSGAGVAIAANKIRGIRAALIHDKALAHAARQDDDINVLALGADFIDADSAQKVVDAFLVTPFLAEERHQRRIDKIKKLEQ